MPAFRAARMKKKIVKIPQNEIVVALGWPEAAVPSSFELEKDFTIDQKRKKLNPWKSVLSAQPFDLLRCREYGQGSRYLRIADFEQRASAGRFQDHLVATPSYVGEPR
jgi:hypothetical protein